MAAAKQSGPQSFQGAYAWGVMSSGADKLVTYAQFQPWLATAKKEIPGLRMAEYCFLGPKSSRVLTARATGDTVGQHFPMQEFKKDPYAAIGKFVADQKTMEIFPHLGNYGNLIASKHDRDVQLNLIKAAYAMNGGTAGVALHTFYGSNPRNSDMQNTLEAAKIMYVLQRFSADVAKATNQPQIGQGPETCGLHGGYREPEKAENSHRWIDRNIAHTLGDRHTVSMLLQRDGIRPEVITVVEDMHHERTAGNPKPTDTLHYALTNAPGYAVRRFAHLKSAPGMWDGRGGYDPEVKDQALIWSHPTSPVRAGNPQSQAYKTMAAFTQIADNQWGGILDQGPRLAGVDGWAGLDEKAMIAVFREFGLKPTSTVQTDQGILHTGTDGFLAEAEHHRKFLANRPDGDLAVVIEDWGANHDALKETLYNGGTPDHLDARLDQLQALDRGAIPDKLMSMTWDQAVKEYGADFKDWDEVPASIIAQVGSLKPAGTER